MNPELLVIGSAFLSGVMGGGHCAVMCGGIATGFAAQNRGGARGAAAWLDGLEPNVGRILAYTLAGAVAGGMGYGIVAVARVEALGMALRAAVGLVLIATALRLLDTHGRLGFLARPAPLRGWFASLRRRLLPANTTPRRMLAGALWGFLPCGLSTTVLTAAWLQSHPAQGAMTMLAFGVGTLPVMLPLTWSGARLGQKLQRGPWRKSAGVLVLLAGVVTLTAPLLFQVPALHPLLTALGCSVS